MIRASMIVALAVYAAAVWLPAVADVREPPITVYTSGVEE